MKSYWFDPQHTGALRIIDNNTKTIRSADSNKEICNFNEINENVVDDFIEKTKTDIISCKRDKALMFSFEEVEKLEN